MKEICIVFLAMFVPFFANCQKSVAGDWVGTLDVGVKLRLVLHINKEAAGNYSGTLDSPDQGAKGIAATSVTFGRDSLHIKVALINGAYDGLLINDSTITGVWTQGMGTVELNLVKKTEEYRSSNSQTPKSTGSYNHQYRDLFDNTRFFMFDIMVMYGLSNKNLHPLNAFANGGLYI